MTERYRTIVADPPWHYGKTGGGYSWRKGSPSGEPQRPILSYPTMTVQEISEIPIQDWADKRCALFLWTTQRYLEDSYGIVRFWGFDPVKLLVWCKPPTGFSMGGTFGNSCEFVLYARKGVKVATGGVSRDWWEWPRKGGHSAKPEAFLDIVEQTHPGPYLEMFARRARFGWDYYGDESLGTAEVAA